jgi:hypothetical protein
MNKEDDMDESKEIVYAKNDELENNFIYHTPKEGQTLKYEEIRHAAKMLAYLYNDLCPKSRELSLALTNLEESSMWANASIARH